MRFIVLAAILSIIAYASAQAVCVPGATSSFTIDNPPAATEASTTFPLGVDATLARIEVEAELISDPSQPHTCDAASPGVDGLCLNVVQDGQNVVLTNKAECAAIAGLYKVVQVRFFFGAVSSAAPSSSAAASSAAPETSSAPASSSASPSSSVAPASSSASPSSSAAPASSSAAPSSSAVPASSSASPASSSASPSSSAAPETSGSPSSVPETKCSCQTTTAKPNVISGNNNAKASSATKVAATSAAILAVAVALL